MRREGTKIDPFTCPRRNGTNCEPLQNLLKRISRGSLKGQALEGYKKPRMTQEVADFLLWIYDEYARLWEYEEFDRL